MLRSINDMCLSCIYFVTGVSIVESQKWLFDCDAPFTPTSRRKAHLYPSFIHQFDTCQGHILPRWKIDYSQSIQCVGGNRALNKIDIETGRRIKSFSLLFPLSLSLSVVLFPITEYLLLWIHRPLKIDQNFAHPPQIC